jgi:hypothetical protein
MEWSRPKQQGLTPSPRAGHAGATVGENWYIVGGGNNKSGKKSELIMLRCLLITTVWSLWSSICVNMVLVHFTS